MTVATLTPVPLPAPERAREAFLTVRARESMKAIMVIEVLSPGNKRANSDGRREYLRKREEVMFAIGKLPGAGHGKDIRILLFGDQAQCLVGRKACIGHDDNLAHPTWGRKILEHLPKKDVLMAFDLRVNRGEGDGDGHLVPTRDQQDHLKPKRIRIMRAVARRMPQGVFPATLGFQRVRGHRGSRMLSLLKPGKIRQLTAEAP